MSIKIKLFAAIKAAAEVLVGLSAGAAASAGVFASITVIEFWLRAGHIEGQPAMCFRRMECYFRRNGGEPYFTAAIIA